MWNIQMLINWTIIRFISSWTIFRTTIMNLNLGKIFSFFFRLNLTIEDCSISDHFLLVKKRNYTLTSRQREILQRCFKMSRIRAKPQTTWKTAFLETLWKTCTHNFTTPKIKRSNCSCRIEAHKLITEKASAKLYHGIPLTPYLRVYSKLIFQIV